MNFLNEHARDLFIFFVVPMAGLLAEYLFSARRATILSVALGLFVFPVFIGYTFAFPRLGIFAEVALFSCLYSLVSRQISGRIKIYGSVIVSLLLFIALGSVSVVNTDQSKTTLEKQWEVGHYQVDYFSNQSFDGGPLLQYALNEYATIPFYLKRLEVAAEPEDMSACAVIFKKSALVFDRCHAKISPVIVRR